MAIAMLRVYSSVKPQPDADVAVIHITDPADPVEGLKSVELHQGQDGFHSVTIIRAGHGGDIAAVLHDRLTSLDFDSQNDLTVAFCSDCRLISAYDALYIAHIDFPDTPMETPSGDTIKGFKTRVSPVVEDDFEYGVLAALDGVPSDANPFPCGTDSHDKWMNGYQSEQSENGRPLATA